jgi:hypothetical protein
MNRGHGIKGREDRSKGIEIRKKKINVLVKECFRAVLLKPVEGMRDRWEG